METTTHGIESPVQAPDPVQNSRFLCPHCGTLLSPADKAQCPCCGMQFCDNKRQEQIERLLRIPLSQTTYTTAAYIPPAVASPLPETTLESAEGTEPAPAAPSSNSHIRSATKTVLTHRRWFIVILAVFLAASLFLAALAAVNNTRLGYNASPEKLIMGFQKALEDRDTDLMASLFVEEERDYIKELSLTSTPLQMEVWDVLQGEKSQFAYMFITLKSPNLSAEYSTGTDYISPLQSVRPFLASKTDGKWYLLYDGVEWRYYIDYDYENNSPYPID